MSDDLTAELGRSQNAYVFRAADGHNSIAIRTSDEELAECYRLMAEARDEIRRLREGIERHRDAGIADNCGKPGCLTGCGHDSRLWALLDAPSTGEVEHG